MIVLALVLFLLALTALTPPIIVLVGQFSGPMSVRLESFISEYDGTIISLGTLFLVSGLGLFTTHLSNKSAERREDYNRKMQASLQIAQFRQGWINELRDELATLRSLLSVKNPAEFSFAAAQETLSKTLFLLNPDEDATKELRRAVKNTAKSHIENKDEDKGQFLKEFDVIAQKIIKAEWERLKLELREAQTIEL